MYKVMKWEVIDSLPPLVVFATIDGFAPGSVLVIWVKYHSFWQNHLAVKVAALIAHTMWDMAGKETPLIAASVLFGHSEEDILFFCSPVARPLLLNHIYMNAESQEQSAPIPT